MSKKVSSDNTSKTELKKETIAPKANASASQNNPELDKTESNKPVTEKNVADKATVDKTVSDTTLSDKTQANTPKSKPSSGSTRALEGKCIQERYLLETKIGSGGMSDIYRAKDLSLEKAGIKDVYVAIKVLQPEFVEQPEALQLLLKEADKTRRLSHPNIIRLYDVDTDGDIHFLVMEYLDGETLDQVIKRSKPKGLKLDGAIKILNQMSDALTYAHQSGIVHTDLKPANIILTRDGHIKLLDFGVAQAIQLNHDKYSAENAMQTAPSGGYTPAYASPELLDGTLPSVSDDVFAFACVAYELLTSKHPFDRLPANKAKQQKKVASKPKHLNGYQWKNLQKALSFSASERTKSVSAVISAFQTNPWPKVAIASAVACTLLITGGFIYQQQNGISNSQRIISEYQDHFHQVERLQHMPTERFLNEYSKQENITEIEKMGLLRFHKSSIIEIYEEKVDHALNDGEHEYPNYPKAETLLADVLALYPDSQVLSKQAIAIQRGKQTAIEALDDRLHAQLRKGQYQKAEDDIYYLLDELKYIDSDYTLSLSKAEIDTYSRSFKSAIENHDVAALEELIDAGKVFFANIEETENLLTIGAQLKDAVTELARYNKAKADGESPAYPYQAATVFYQSSFDSLNEQVTNSRTVASLDKVYNQVSSLSEELPSDFTPLVTVRKNMADKYLSLADELLKKRQVRTANRVMKRANKLISSTNI